MFWFQDAESVLLSFKNGDFGASENEQLVYKTLCQERFPYALVFKDPVPIVESHSDDILSNKEQENE